MSLIDLACPLGGAYPVERAMAVINWFGHGSVAIGVALVLMTYGVVARDRRVRQAGFAVLLAFVVAGLLADLLKAVFQVGRPASAMRSYSFPSGHATTAFATAGVLGWAFPAAAPFLYFLAVLAGVARVYYRAHFVSDILAGGLLGTASGVLIARKLLGPSPPEAGRPRARWGWLLPAAVGIPVVAFFLTYEHVLAAHRLRGPRPSGNPGPTLSIQFGTPEARELLLEGWSGDERWQGQFPFVWGQGSESKLRIPSLPSADFRVRLRMRPWVAHRGLSCQVVEVAVSGAPVARLLLDRGWHDYEVKLPRRLIGSEPNEIELRFAYGQRSGAGKNERMPSVAFASLEAVPADRSN